MGRPVVRQFDTSKTILKHFPYLGFAVVVPETMGVQVGDKKLVVAGTPFPTNDSACKGLLLETVDVTNGDNAGTVVYEGDIDNAKLAEAGITVDSTAKAVLPRVTFFD